MSERNGYEPGVPCWVAGVHPDPEQAVGFYTTLFGWEAEDTMPPGSPRSAGGRDRLLEAEHEVGIDLLLDVA